jgi:hypothetical protein
MLRCGWPMPSGVSDLRMREAPCAAQPAKTTLFAGGLRSTVRKTAAGQFFQLTKIQWIVTNG